MNARNEERAVRHARQGLHAAASAFCKIRLNSATPAEARRLVDEALARLDQGPAPQAFKDAAREEFARRFRQNYPGETDFHPIDVHPRAEAWSGLDRP